MNYKNYNWCNWNKSWVENNPERKVANECRLHRKLEELKKSDSQGYAQSLKCILIYLNQEAWQPTQVEGGIIIALTTAALIMVQHIHLLCYLMTLINPQLLTALTLAATTVTVTYAVTKTTVMVFNRYHMWTNNANTVMRLWESIKPVFKINKLLAQITNTGSKLKI